MSIALTHESGPLAGLVVPGTSPGFLGPPLRAPCSTAGCGRSG